MYEFKYHRPATLQQAVNLLAESEDAMLIAGGHTLVRWITADDNYRGRAVYDRVATRTMWITYDIVT